MCRNESIALIGGGGPQTDCTVGVARGNALPIRRPVQPYCGRTSALVEQTNGLVGIDPPAPEAKAQVTGRD